MISSLDISSLGVIERAHLDFGPGLTVLTGETGAGKTMVLTSLQLLLGGRADAALVRGGSGRADVDGVFAVPTDVGDAVEDAGGIVEDGELIVSRSIPTSGRSRAHLGGRPVPAAVLHEVVGSLVTIHGQADQLRLTSAAAQRRALDSFGGADHASLLEEYSAAWERAVGLKKRLDAALADSLSREEEIARLRAATEAITALDAHAGEDDELTAEARRLTNVQDLRADAGRAHAILRGAEDSASAIDSIRTALECLRNAERFDPELEEMTTRLSSAILDVEALADDIRSYGDRLDADPERLARVQERRAALRTAMKGRAADVGGLLEWNEKAVERLSELTRPGSDPESLRIELKNAQDEVLEVGARVSTARRELGARLSDLVDVELHALSMPDAHLDVQLSGTKPTSHGLEDVVLALRPHPSAPARPLGQGASGGELSRVMLALEVILGADSAARTLIFDEVDAGIGGLTATEVGSRLARLAEDRQVIVVTHLAQVAVFAQHHLVVSKNDGVASVRSVAGDEREAELTRMMGGDPDSQAARRNAVQVLGSAVPQSR